MHRIARLLQTVYQPIPVKGGLYNQTLEVSPMRLYLAEDRPQVIRESLLLHHSIRLIQQRHHTIVGV